MPEVQEDLLPRSVTFATCALIVFVLVFVVIGIHTYGDEQDADVEEGGERRKRRCRTLRGCFMYFRKTSATLPLWKSLLLKFGVVLVTTLGSTCVSLVINNAAASHEETIKQTIAEILNFESVDNEDRRRKRETCVESNESDCWQDKVRNMIDRPEQRLGEDLCDTINGWGDTIDPLFCTLFVSMVIFVLISACCLMVPVVAFLLLGPAFKALKADEISHAVVTSIRGKMDRLKAGHRELKGGVTDDEVRSNTREFPTEEATNAHTEGGLSMGTQTATVASTTTPARWVESSPCKGAPASPPTQALKVAAETMAMVESTDVNQTQGRAGATEDDIMTSE